MKIYTKTGDTGTTSLYGGARVRKDDARVQTYGTIDECNAVLGLAVAHMIDDELRACVLRVQGELLELGADLAAPLSRGDITPRMKPEHSARLESEIDSFESELEPLRNFVLPGGCTGGAFLHQARSVSRRAERLLVSLAETEAINPEALIYANRLSDYLFVLARITNHRTGTPEPIWERPQA